MTLRRVVLADDAVGSWVTDEHGRRPAEPGEALAFARLAAELSELTGVDTEVAGRMPRDDPGTALIVPVGMVRELAPGALARTVIAGADRTTMFDTLEQLGVAGAVERSAWGRWQAGPPAGTHAAVVGRRELAGDLGTEVRAEPPFASEHYAPLSSPEHPTMPALLAAYLHAYFTRLAPGSS